MKQATSKSTKARPISNGMNIGSKIKIEVKKTGNETNASLVRRFSRRMQESRNLSKAKSIRYNKRAPSELTMKRSALKKIAKRKEIERLIKLGKIQERR